MNLPVIHGTTDMKKVGKSTRTNNGATNNSKSILEPCTMSRKKERWAIRKKNSFSQTVKKSSLLTSCLAVGLSMCARAQANRRAQSDFLQTSWSSLSLSTNSTSLLFSFLSLPFVFAPSFWVAFFLSFSLAFPLLQTKARLSLLCSSLSFCLSPSL